MNASRSIGWLATGVRWAARISGLALAILVVVFMIGNGVPNVLAESVSVQLEFLAMAIMLAGFILGWPYEAAGGCLVLAGFGLFVGVELFQNGSPPGGAIPLFCVPGLLLLTSSAVSRAAGRSSPT